jgi:hypothetical protein
MRILALDLASRTGVADGEPGGAPELAFVDFDREHDKDADIFARAARWTARRLHDARPDLVVVEAPVPKYDKSLQMGIRGVVLGLVTCKDVRVIEVEVQTWRKYALGFGNLKGKIAKAQCVELCGRLGWKVPRTKRGDPDHNAAEAGGIWLWGCAQLDPKNAVRHEPLFTGAA